MKNLFIIALCVSFLTVGCESDDGYRDVTLEIESSAIPISNDPNNPSSLMCYVRLQSQNPDIDLRLDSDHRAFTAIPEQTLTSDAVSWAVNSNVRRTIGVSGFDGVSNALPCDVTIRIKADNKVIWSYSAKKGDDEFGEQANLIIK